METIILTVGKNYKTVDGHTVYLYKKTKYNVYCVCEEFFDPIPYLVNGTYPKNPGLNLIEEI